MGEKTYVAVKAAVRAVVEETLALAGSAAARCLTEGNGTEEDEEAVAPASLEELGPPLAQAPRDGDDPERGGGDTEDDPGRTERGVHGAEVSPD